MAEETRKNAPENVVESNATEIKTETPKKPRKPREKVREIEEIIDLPLNKLSEKEKDKLINYFKANITEAFNKVEAYKQNAESALKRCSDISEQYDAMESFYRKQLKYIDMQLETFKMSVNQVTKGGIQ